MNGIWILLLSTIIAALPAIIAFFLLRSRKSALTLPWFLASLAAGIISFIAAAFIQNFFTTGRQSGFWPLFINIFIRIALVEESSRLLGIIPLWKTGKNSRLADSSIGAAMGLAAGLGFALIESAYHGIADLNIALLRLVTAAPLHGACGIRVGTAIFVARRDPLKTAILFVSSVLIHGAYNLIIINPVIPSILAIPAALLALFVSLNYLMTKNADDKNPNLS